MRHRLAGEIYQEVVGNFQRSYFHDLLCIEYCPTGKLFILHIVIMADKTKPNAVSGSKLAALNSATLGAEMPQITLPDGSKVQTGTVGLVPNYCDYYGTALS